MTRFVDAHFSSAWEADLRESPPPCFLDLGTLNASRDEPLHLDHEVITHEIELGTRRVGGVDGHLRGR